MTKTAHQEGPPARPGDHLRKLAKYGSFGGLFFSLLGTGLAWAGSDSINCPSVVWQTSLALNFLVFVLTWAAYLPFRNTDLLLGNGLLSIFLLFNGFWMFGFGGFYFYFLFAPINIFIRATAIVILTTTLFYRAYLTCADINEAFKKSKHLFGRMYCDEEATITFKREAIALLEKARTDRNPFKSFHLYAAMVVAPFVLVLNRLLTPVFGDGHGFFLVLAFLAAPLLLWIAGLIAQTAMTMIYYPIKLQHETGKPVLLKDW